MKRHQRHVARRRLRRAQDPEHRAWEREVNASFHALRRQLDTSYRVVRDRIRGAVQLAQEPQS